MKPTEAKKLAEKFKLKTLPIKRKKVVIHPIGAHWTNYINEFNKKSINERKTFNPVKSV